MTKRVVLYAEDMESDRLFMQMAFRKAGVDRSLRTVPDGSQAVDYLVGTGLYGDREQHPLPAVVLLDLNMPLMSGFEVLEWMRERPEMAELPVVVFTSSMREEDRARAKELGVADYVEKPSTLAGLGQVVERLKSQWL